jgi:hypothetical protein
VGWASVRIGGSRSVLIQLKSDHMNENENLGMKGARLCVWMGMEWSLELHLEAHRNRKIRGVRQWVEFHLLDFPSSRHCYQLVRHFQFSFVSRQSLSHGPLKTSKGNLLHCSDLNFHRMEVITKFKMRVDLQVYFMLGLGAQLSLPLAKYDLVQSIVR